MRDILHIAQTALYVCGPRTHASACLPSVGWLVGSCWSGQYAYMVCAGLIAAAEEVGGGDGEQTAVISPTCATFLARDGVTLSARGTCVAYAVHGWIGWSMASNNVRNCTQRFHPSARRPPPVCSSVPRVRSSETIHPSIHPSILACVRQPQGC